MRLCASPSFVDALRLSGTTFLLRRMAWCAISSRAWVTPSSKRRQSARPGGSRQRPSPHIPHIFRSTGERINPMTQTEILAKMQTVFDDVFLDDVKVTPELSANDVEEWDSLLQISLVLGVEKAFGVRFRVGEVEATKNLGE